MDSNQVRVALRHREEALEPPEFALEHFVGELRAGCNHLEGNPAPGSVFREEHLAISAAADGGDECVAWNDRQ
jgi:hypothetical protein